MTDSFIEWFYGTLIFFVISFIVYLFGLWVNPMGHLSFLECWGALMLIIVLRSGYLEYINGYDINEEDE